MPETIDGPSSPFFKPVALKTGLRLADLAAGIGPLPAGISSEMAAAFPQAPCGSCVCWGIPFEIDQVVVLSGVPQTVEIAPTRARWLVFQHTSDLRTLQAGPDGFISPMPGHGRLGEHAADYIVQYAGGTQVRAAIRRRHHLGAFMRGWGENCVQSVAHHKPFPIRGAHEQLSLEWGWSQTRVSSADEEPWVNWLWGWENPHPERLITGFRFEPAEGALVISAVTAGEVDSLPLRWQPRRKACFALPKGQNFCQGQSFCPDLDEHGILEQVKIDLGQVISAGPRLVYPNEAWAGTYDNRLPDVSPTEILVEYTAHPQACFHFDFGSSSQIIPVAEVEAARSGDTVYPVSPAEHMVRLRVVERRSGKTVPVRLHMHGESGEYLAPLDRHRTINLHWFQDYSAEFARIQDWDDRARQHPCTYIPGETRVKLPAGRVYLEVTKGFEIRPVRQVVPVGPHTEEIVIEIEKILPWREGGWVTADTHVHFLSPATAMLEGAAEGVNVINLLASQWGELMTNVGDFDGMYTWGALETGGGPQGDGEYLVRVGSENRQHVLGHISLLGYRGPLIVPMTTGGPNESALGDPVESLLLEWARQCHAQGGLVVLPHFPNPRLENAAGIVSGEVDAIEMTSWDDNDRGISPYSLSDWYRYLNCGYMVPAVGGTDKMSAMMAVGTVRTYARLKSGQGFNYENWKKAIRRGETFVTYGPLLEFMVEGHPMGSRIELPAGGGSLAIMWQVASVTTPLSRVDLVVNGEIRESTAVSSEAGAGQWTVRLDRSAWLALLVRGRYPDHPEIVCAHSSPVMVTVAGSPLISAPDALTILDQIEGAVAYIDTVGTRAEDRVYKRMRLELETAYQRLHIRLHQAGYDHSGS